MTSIRRGCAAGLVSAFLAVGLTAAGETAGHSPTGVTPSAQRATVADLAWLVGDWRAATEDGDFSQEVWTGPTGGALMGMWWWAKDGAVRLVEFLVITGGDAPVMRLRHFDARLVGWDSERDGPLELQLVESGDRLAVFEGREGAKTIRLTYRRAAGDALEVVLEEEGKTHSFPYRLHR